jgi:hypothetical protein
MADERTLAGIPHCLNVVSNVPFAAVGLLGLVTVGSRRRGPPALHASWERWPYAALFIGMVLTAVGSSYYHLAPDNARLFWDRLPMTLGFMGLLTAVIGERVGVRAARRLFVPLLVLGAASVGYWRWTELRGAEDLRLYGLVQFGSLLIVVVLVALYPDPYRNRAYLFGGIGAYAAAKILEALDDHIFALGNIVSGHTLKHLAAAGGVAIVIAMLRARAGSSASAGAGNVIGARARR